MCRNFGCHTDITPINALTYRSNLLETTEQTKENCDFRYSISSRGRFRIQVYPFRKDCFPYKSLFFALQKHWITFNVPRRQGKDDATTHCDVKERFSQVGRVDSYKPIIRTLVRIYPQNTLLYQHNSSKLLDRNIPFSKSRACIMLRAH